MIDVFKYEKRGKYPHMKPADVAIWERFIEKYPDAYDTCQYDFNVGDPPPFDPMGDNGEDLNQDALYRLKIDVVGKKGKSIDLIELKPKAGPSTIGQIKGYRHLYKRDAEVKAPVNCIVITDKLMSNMEYIAKMEGVNIVVV